MKSLLAIIALFTIFGTSLGDLRYRGNAVHPDYPGQCYYEELEQPIAINQTYKPINRDDRCESIYCRRDFVLELRYCGRHNMMQNATCRIVSDLTRAFPECCPKLECRGNESENNLI